MIGWNGACIGLVYEEGNILCWIRCKIVTSSRAVSVMFYLFEAPFDRIFVFRRPNMTRNPLNIYDGLFVLPM